MYDLQCDLILWPCYMRNRDDPQFESSPCGPGVCVTGNKQRSTFPLLDVFLCSSVNICTAIMKNNAMKNSLETFSNSLRANFYTNVKKRNWSLDSSIPPVVIFLLCECNNSTLL